MTLFPSKNKRKFPTYSDIIRQYFNFANKKTSSQGTSKDNYRGAQNGARGAYKRVKFC